MKDGKPSKTFLNEIARVFKTQMIVKKWLRLTKLWNYLAGTVKIGATIIILLLIYCRWIFLFS